MALDIGREASAETAHLCRQGWSSADADRQPGDAPALVARHSADAAICVAEKPAAPPSRLDSDLSPLAWLDGQAEIRRCSVEEMAPARLADWSIEGEPLRLRHRSGRFFTVGAVEVTSTYEAPRRWVQPAFEQYEIGLLGMLARQGRRGLELLVQAKAEPGDIHGAQAAPTVQATRSNYLRVHQGALPAYVQWFRDRRAPGVLLDRLQPEHGSFFLRKYNRNMIVLVDEDLAPEPTFRWMTPAEIASLLERPNRVNMSLRSLLSCLAGAGAERSDVSLPGWFADYAARGRLQLRRRGLDHVPGGSTGAPFEIIGIQAESRGREVARWHQPIIRASAGRVDLLMRREARGGAFLVRAAAEPGHRKWLALGPSWCSYASDTREPARARFGHDLVNIAGKERFDQWLSEDGGRFMGFQNRYRIVEVDAESVGPLPPGFGWVDAATLRALAARGFATIELRSLLAAWWLADGGRPPAISCQLSAVVDGPSDSSRFPLLRTK
jgi:dTDP-4-dehydro-6-deoxy-alpha-D-glucopyranose 2,3-dehydratase